MDTQVEVDTRPLTIEQKRQKIKLNYETIAALKDKLNQSEGRHKSAMTRAAYVKMILDATQKVNDQNKEIAKVIAETRRLHKEIGSLSGRLSRSFALVENTISKGAKCDKWCSACHRLLKTMHESCDQLIIAVEDTGEISREIRQLEDQIGRIKTARTYGST